MKVLFLLFVFVTFFSCSKKKEISDGIGELFDSLGMFCIPKIDYHDTASYSEMVDRCSDSFIDSVCKYTGVDTFYFSIPPRAILTNNNSIIYTDRNGDTVFHYDLNREIWIKRKVTKTTAIFMMFGLMAGRY